MKIISYQDLAVDKRHGFVYQDTSSEKEILVIKEQVFPGAAGYPDMYVRHLKTTFQDEEYLIISQTDYELTPAKKTRNSCWCS